MTALFVFALPFIIYGIVCGSYCLGRSLARLVPVLWARFRKKKKGPPLAVPLLPVLVLNEM